MSSTCFEHPSVYPQDDLYMRFYGISLMHLYKQSGRWQDVLDKHILPSENLKMRDINDLSIYGCFRRCMKKFKKVKEGGSRTDLDISVNFFSFKFECFNP